VLNIAIMTSYLAWSSKRVSHLISTHPSIMISIINQIQASIIGEGKLRWVNMKKMQKKNKRISIYKIEHKLPLKASHKDGKHQFPLQSSKVRSIKGFGENISQLSLCINVTHLDISLSTWSLLSRCLILLWKIGFLATEMALVLSHMRGTLSKITLKSLMVCTIHRIWEHRLAAATYSASMVDGATEDCFQEDQ
jgi:hypothetical protein